MSIEYINNNHKPVKKRLCIIPKKYQGIFIEYQESLESLLNITKKYSFLQTKNIIKCTQYRENIGILIYNESLTMPVLTNNTIYPLFISFKDYIQSGVILTGDTLDELIDQI